MTDAWTSVGVVAGGGRRPAHRLAVAQLGHRLRRRGEHHPHRRGLVRRSVAGLLDDAFPPDKQAQVQAVLDRYAVDYTADGVQFHALRTRQSGPRHFLTVHVLVPGAWSVPAGPRRAGGDRGRPAARALPSLNTSTHLEPLEDPALLADTAIDRLDPRPRHSLAASGPSRRLLRVSRRRPGSSAGAPSGKRCPARSPIRRSGRGPGPWRRISTATPAARVAPSATRGSGASAG